MVSNLITPDNDTEKFLPHNNKSRPVYSSSSRFCQSKSSIIISRIITVMVLLSILLGGAVLAGVYRHHPTDCDYMDVQNCSIVCQSSFILSPEPSSVSEVDITPTSVMRPSSTLFIMTPSLVATPTRTPVMTRDYVYIGNNETNNNCQC